MDPNLKQREVSYSVILRWCLMGLKLGGLDSFRFKDRLKELTVCSTTEKSLLIMWNYLQQRKTEEEKKKVEKTHKRISPFLLP